MSYSDFFLDFEAVKNWFENTPNLDMADTKIPGADSCNEIDVLDLVVDDGSCLSVVQELVVVDDGSSLNLMTEAKECEMAENTSWPLVEDLEKVSLIGETENPIDVRESAAKSETTDVDLIIGGNDDKKEASSGEPAGNSELVGEDGEEKEAVKEEDVGESSESESASTSSSSSSSSSSDSSGDDEDDDGDDEIKEGEVEEGEITDVGARAVMADEDAEAMIAWSDADDEEDDGIKGPIRSKNEAKVLPPVPVVEATLLPHHLIQPVGTVLSILGTQVIVEGVEKHSPLSDGSILWISESRSPLGLIDEIFGPVKNPYYIVRYNSEAEVPTGLAIGASISFVPEFASHVLDNKDIHKKGYDASGANDEEMSDDGEFSDDEQEAEFRRTLKASKRGAADPKPRKSKGNKKNFENRGEPWRGQNSSPQQNPIQPGPGLPNQHQPPQWPQFSPFRAGPPPMWQNNNNNNNNNAPPNGPWSNGMLFQQQPPLPQQGGYFPNGFPGNNMQWPPQNSQQYPQQMPMQMQMPNNFMPFNQQVNNPNQSVPGQPNNMQGMPFGMGFAGQNNGFNARPPFGMGLQGQQPSPSSYNPGQQGMASNGPVMGQGFNTMPPFGMGLQSQQPAQPNSNTGEQGMASSGFGMGHGYNTMPPFGMGLQGQQPAQPNLNTGEQGMASNGLGMGQGFDAPQSGGAPGNNEAPRQFNSGPSNRGRGSHRRGGGRFSRGRGRNQ